jgi:hypothetical protein
MSDSGSEVEFYLEFARLTTQYDAAKENSATDPEAWEAAQEELQAWRSTMIFLGGGGGIQVAQATADPAATPVTEG